MIVAALNKGADALGFRDTKLWGEQIEDRGSQVTFSTLGQQAPVAEKEAWDPDGAKKRKLRDYVAKEIPEFEVRVGGSTSIDVTKHGIDKAYGIKKLIALLGVAKEELIFVGDRLDEGGNDDPVKAMGFDCLKVSGWKGRSSKGLAPRGSPFASKLLALRASRVGGLRVRAGT
jgi:phosphomannomutase